MYTHAYDAKFMKIYEDEKHKPMATFEVDLGFRVWKVVPLQMDEAVPEGLKPGDMVRIYTRLQRSSLAIGAYHYYHGKVSRKL